MSAGCRRCIRRSVTMRYGSCLGPVYRRWEAQFWRLVLEAIISQRGSWLNLTFGDVRSKQ
jgi:hypothetical protein